MPPGKRPFARWQIAERIALINAIVEAHATLYKMIKTPPSDFTIKENIDAWLTANQQLYTLLTKTNMWHAPACSLHREPPPVQFVFAFSPITSTRVCLLTQ